MTIEPVAAKQARSSRQRYFEDGCATKCGHRAQEIPGVTTVLGILAKPALIPWANGLGLQGIKVGQYVDALANVGRCAHAMIVDLTRAQEKDRVVYIEAFGVDAVPLAENAVLKYLEWAKHHELRTILAETPMVSDLGYGGTPDWYGLLDGQPAVLDFKTSRGIYDEHIYQLAAYAGLLRRNGYQVASGRILQIGRTEDEGFSERTVTDLEWYEEVFQHAFAIYRIQRAIRKGGDE